MIDQGRLRIALVEPDGVVARALTEALSGGIATELVAVAGDLRIVLESIGQRAVDAIVLDLAAHPDPVTAVRAIHERRPSTLVVITGKAPPMIIARCMAAGAATYIPKPFKPEELVTTVRELRGVTFRPAVDAPRPRRGSVVVVYGPKGGVGGTTVATSLAVALAASKARVALVDLDLQFGDVGVALDLKNSSSIADLLAHQGPLDAATVADVFVRHSSGVHALLAPADPPDMGSVDVEAIVRLIEKMRAVFDYIVCDLWSSLEDLALATIRAADRVVLVTTPEVPSLRHLRRVISATDPLLRTERTLVVANRAPSKTGLTLPEMERALGMPIGAAIPSDGAGVTKAINEGRSMLDPRAGVRTARAFRALADQIATDLARDGAAASAATAASVAS